MRKKLFLFVFLSRSLRARGLKFTSFYYYEKSHIVALFTGAWIEIFGLSPYYWRADCRALYGRVD